MRSHGRSGYTSGGCRCDVCAEAERAYSRSAVCVDCGGSCQPSKPQRGWTPPEHPRCWECYMKSRRDNAKPPSLCNCGARKERTSTKCRSCYLPRVKSKDTTTRQSVWISPVGAKINSRAWRKLRAAVIREEPTCRIQIPGLCTGVSDCADHIVPRSKNPTLTMVRSNLRGSCTPCNMALGNGGWRGLHLRIIPSCLVLPQPTPEIKIGKPGVQDTLSVCPLCVNLFVVQKSRYCSDACRQEINARSARDRYRDKVGLSVNPNEPTKFYGRR